MTDTPVISMLIVNWRTGAMARGLVKNSRRQRLPGLQPGQGIEFIVLDNASGPEEEGHLKELEADGVKVIRSRQNSGYAAGMNMACEQATGDYILVCNPDVMLFRGMLTRMLEHMQTNPRCGLVGPKAFLDPERFFQLPPNELESLCSLTSETVARAIPAYGQRHAANRTRRAIAQWTATGPVSASQVSGFCMLMKRSLANVLGPFDTRYPFYFEDSDLCMRLHRKGFTTDVLPNAEMVHFFNRSAGQDQLAAMSRFEVSRRIFFQARYGRLGRWMAQGLMAFTAGRTGKGHEFAPVDVLGECETVPVLDVPGTGAYIAEIAVDQGFVYAAGRLDVTRKFRIPQVVWDGFVDSTYYVRFLQRRSLKILRTVSMTKVGLPKPITAETAAAELVHT